MDDDLLRAASQQAELNQVDGVRRGWTASQWVILAAMAGLLVAIMATLILIVRSGSVPAVDVVATAIAGPTPTSTPPVLVVDAVLTPAGLYWPPEPEPLAEPNAPSDLLWWDSRFLYRAAILLDDVAKRAPAGTWARTIFDGEGAQRSGQMRADGFDLRLLVWDGERWWEIPRAAHPRLEKRGWDILFHLQDPEIANLGGYYLYFGNPKADPPPRAEDAPETSRLLLALDDAESVEWGPEVFWSVHSMASQRIVSPDGRIVIECPPGGPQSDVSVRLRTVPLAEKNTHGSMPNYELHADPPPEPLDPSNVIRWRPPLQVTLNWAGRAVDIVDLETWDHFVYDTTAGRWYGVPVEFDAERGLILITTDQP